LTDFKLLVLNLPNPPKRKVNRDYAGGFGTAVHLSRLRRKQSGKPYLNLFLPYSAAVAEECGYEYRVLDAQALELSVAKVIENAKSYDPDIVFSMVALPSIYEDKNILNSIKQELPNTKIVACGSVCNVMPEEVLMGSNIDTAAHDFFPYVDSLHHVLVNFKELTDMKLPGFSYIKDNEVRSNPSTPPEKVFTEYTPKYEILPLKNYEHISMFGKKVLYIPILGSTGCPYSCQYCPYPIGFGKQPIFNQPKSTVDDIEHLNQKDFEFFDFRNQSFTLNKKWAMDVCKEIMNRKLEISWFCEARVDETSKKILAEMYSSGCRRIQYGVETGDPALIGMAKPGAHLPNVQETFKAARELGIWRHAHMILGLLGENKKTLQTTLEFLLDIDPDSITLNFATPYPGTVMHEIAKKNNWLITSNWRNYSSFEVVMTTPDLSAEDLYEMSIRIEKALMAQKIKHLLANGLDMNGFKDIADHYIQTIITELSLKNRIRSFRRKQQYTKFKKIARS
jgi:radical SAM superfamily enzyme YgiQ (UPF0313 family)